MNVEGSKPGAALYMEGERGGGGWRRLVYNLPEG